MTGEIRNVLYVVLTTDYGYDVRGVSNVESFALRIAAELAEYAGPVYVAMLPEGRFPDTTPEWDEAIKRYKEATGRA